MIGKDNEDGIDHISIITRGDECDTFMFIFMKLGPVLFNALFAILPYFNSSIFARR